MDGLDSILGTMSDMTAGMDNMFAAHDMRESMAMQGIEAMNRMTDMAQHLDPHVNRDLYLPPIGGLMI